MQVVHFDPSEYDMNAEDMGMLSALYSRSAESVVKHLEKVKQSGSGKFMSQYYVGYGHQSIGDCADTTLFLEGVSILAAKAIQDTPLYNGQESSTRYINWLEQPFATPEFDASSLRASNTSHEGDVIHHKLRMFYKLGFERLPAILAKEFPMQEGENEGNYLRAINARAFDILRGYLPAGATTNLSWKASLRVIHDRLIKLANHPLLEVRELAIMIHAKVYKVFPSSFKPFDWYLNNGSGLSLDHFYSVPKTYHHPNENPTVEFMNLYHPTSLQDEIAKFHPRVGLPPEVDFILGQVQIEGDMDYGSHRDLQRHRPGFNIMPLLSTGIGFEQWYVDELRDPDLISAALEVIHDVTVFAGKTDLAEVDLQYYLPMGFKVHYQCLWSWSHFLYVLRLRSTNVIHATFRRQVIEWAQTLEREEALDLSAFYDQTPGKFDVKRGAQTIMAVHEN